MRPGRYLAVIGFGTRAAALAVASRAAAQFSLVQRFELENLVVFADAAIETSQPSPGAVVVGRTLPNAAAWSLGYTRRGEAVGGQGLIDGCWGDYVAFIQPPGDPAVQVIRAPSGGLPAFRARRDGLTVIGSDVDMLIALGLASTAIDWTFVAHHLAFPHLRGALTGLADIDEVFPGDGTILRAGGSEERRALWSPWRFVTRDAQFAVADAARSHLRQVLLDTISMLAQPYESVLLELSGGLDSSIVAACLAACAPQVRALNLVTPGAEGDERRYARLVGARLAIPIIESPIDATIDLTRPVHRRTPRPGIPAILGGIDRQFIGAAAAQASDAFFSGTGGDSVFCSLGSSAPAADAWRRFGPGRCFRRTVSAVAEIHEINVWRATAMALRYARRPGNPAWPRTTTFLDADRLPQVSLFHPWLTEPPRALGGSRSHIRSIMAALAHVDGYARQAVAPSVFPLLSQPVIEACLRIPTWMWVDGGRDRAVARQAFVDTLPAAIINRRTKGAMDALCVQTFQKNRVRLRSYLLDGHLAATGLLDRPGLEDYLGQDGPVRDDLFYRLLPVIDTEAWLRGWLDGRVAADGGSDA